MTPDHYFVDAACTLPLVVLPPGGSAPAGVPRGQLTCGEVKYAVIRSGRPENIRVHHLGARYDGNFFLGPDSCRPGVVEGPLVAWRVGAEIPSSDMVELRRVTR